MGVIDNLKMQENLAVILADKNGLIIYVNHMFELVFGWLLSEIKGKPLTTIIPSHLHDSHHLGFSRFLMTEKATILNKPISLYAVKKNGDKFSAIHTISAEKINNEWIFGATIQPKD